MPRRRRTMPRPAPRPAAKRSAAPAPRAQAAPPAQQSSGGGMMSGLMGTVAQGMAFGTGSAIAHRAVGAVANSVGGSDEGAPVEQQPAAEAGGSVQIEQPQVCQFEQQAFYTCLQQNQGQITSCTPFFEAVQQCQSMQSQGSFS